MDKTEAREACDSPTPAICLMKRLSLTSRTLFVLRTILGFRFAPPQALCYRRASRAQRKFSIP